MQESVKQGSPLKRNNSNDKLDAEPKENLDQQWERKERERKMQEWRE